MLADWRLKLVFGGGTLYFHEYGVYIVNVILNVLFMREEKSIRELLLQFAMSRWTSDASQLDLVLHWEWNECCCSLEKDK